MRRSAGMSIFFDGDGAGFWCLAGDMCNRYKYIVLGVGQSTLDFGRGARHASVVDYMGIWNVHDVCVLRIETTRHIQLIWS
jgi:hypothetical protein